MIGPLLGAVAARPLRLAQPFWTLGPRLVSAPGAFLLDGGEGTGDRGRWSYLGAWPRLRFAASGRRPGAVGWQLDTVDEALEPRSPLALGQVVGAGDPWAPLRALEAGLGMLEGRAPAPFRAGWVGYLGYGARRWFEALPSEGLDTLEWPDLELYFHDRVLAHDARSGESWALAAAWGDTAGAARARAEDAADLLQREAEDTDALGPIELELPELPRRLDVNAPFDRARYRRMVETARAAIVDGEVFEVCTTHSLDTAYAGDAWSLHAVLRRDNPAPYAAVLDRGRGRAVVSASPECFLRVDADRWIESRPIKGTRRREEDPTLDAAVAAELATAEKDRAENLMIVDLVRNDLGRVAEVGSVEAPAVCEVETYATVHQLVSTVRARLAPEHDRWDLIAASFPGGSMTGAPKIEAMKIIDRLEPTERGVYSGALGWLDLGGAMELSMVIRSVVLDRGRAWLGVGGAVTADSDPDAEYDETLAKAEALLAALSLAG